MFPSSLISPNKHRAKLMRNSMVDSSSADFVNVIPLFKFGLELKACFEVNRIALSITASSLEWHGNHAGAELFYHQLDACHWNVPESHIHFRIKGQKIWRETQELTDSIMQMRFPANVQNYFYHQNRLKNLWFITSALKIDGPVWDGWDLQWIKNVSIRSRSALQWNPPPRNFIANCSC